MEIFHLFPSEKVPLNHWDEGEFYGCLEPRKHGVCRNNRLKFIKIILTKFSNLFCLDCEALGSILWRSPDSPDTWTSCSLTVQSEAPGLQNRKVSMLKWWGNVIQNLTLFSNNFIQLGFSPRPGKGFWFIYKQSGN